MVEIQFGLLWKIGLVFLLAVPPVRKLDVAKSLELRLLVLAVWLKTQKELARFSQLSMVAELWLTQLRVLTFAFF